ncbi:MAG: hypothetical protein AAF533_05030 [Acidobacteriota bacterium]
MKSAYEKALERLEKEGIDAPRRGALTDEQREQMAQVRQDAEAKLAEMEILHRDRMAGIRDPAAREKELEEYQIDRRRVEDGRDRKVEAIRNQGD